MPEKKRLSREPGKTRATKESLAGRIVLAGMIIFVLSGWFWWTQVYSSPRNVFEGMLANTLQTNGITRITQQENNGSQVQQKIHLQLGANNFTKATAELNEKNSQGTSRIVTETFGTPTTDYIRYNNIETSQKNATGQDFDFSEVIGEWGVSSSGAPGLNGELFNQSMLGIIPFGMFSYSDRKDLLNLIKEEEVFDVDYQNVQRSTQRNRPVITFDVQVDAEGYITYLKEFAARAGLTRLEDINSSDYAGSNPIEISLSVDVWAHQLVQSSNSGRIENYGSYGVIYDAESPADSIGLEELQRKLREIQ